MTREAWLAACADILCGDSDPDAKSVSELSEILNIPERTLRGRLPGLVKAGRLTRITKTIHTPNGRRYVAAYRIVQQ